MALPAAAIALLTLFVQPLGTAAATPAPRPTTAPPSPSPSLTPSQSPKPTATPPPPPTPTALPSPSPSPSPRGDVNLIPASAPPDSHITVSGSGFEPNLAITIVFDGGDPPLASVTTSGGGFFSQQIVVPDGQGPDHTICARTPNGDRCAGFRLEPRPSPSNSPSPQPSPSVAVSVSPGPSAAPSPAASPVPGTGSSPLGFVTRPPFVFFPLLVVAGLVGWLTYYLWGLRPLPEVHNVTVVHRAVQARGYVPHVPEVAPSPPPAPEVHLQPPPPKPPPAPGAPSAADVPPDLPTPSD